MQKRRLSEFGTEKFGQLVDHLLKTRLHVAKPPSEVDKRKQAEQSSSLQVILAGIKSAQQRNPPGPPTAEEKELFKFCEKHSWLFGISPKTPPKAGRHTLQEAVEVVIELDAKVRTLEVAYTKDWEQPQPAQIASPLRGGECGGDA